MGKVIKQTEIKKLLAEGKKVKEISELLNTNIAYVYKLKRETQNSILITNQEIETI
jgi:DNA-binding CsgD family transcriptional regulator